MQVDAIGALLARPEALDARQRALREALARYDASWRAELAARAQALEVDGEHSEAMDHDEPEMIPEKDKDMEAPSIPID